MSQLFIVETQSKLLLVESLALAKLSSRNFSMNEAEFWNIAIWPKMLKSIWNYLHSWSKVRPIKRMVEN